MRRVDHLLDTVDCVQPGCPEEAAKGSVYCAHHRLYANRPKPAEGDEQPASVFPTPLHAIRYLRDAETTAPAAPEPTADAAQAPAVGAPSSTEETTVTLATCKIEGCDNPRLDARGVYGGLCAGHKNEKREQRAAVVAVKPPPADPAPKEPVVPDQPAARLALLTVEIDQAREHLGDLQAEALQLLDLIREQVAA